MRQNEVLLNPEKYKELYAEIHNILPSVEYCLAPRKTAEKAGAASLRSSVSVTEDTKEQKDPGMLDTHGKKLYEWLDTSRVSRVRMLAQWQSAGGLSFVCGCHHRAAQCFRYHGNSEHGDGGSSSVSLEEFQDAIKSRHRIGSRGIESVTSTQNDFAEK